MIRETSIHSRGYKLLRQINGNAIFSWKHIIKTALEMLNTSSKLTAHATIGFGLIP